MFLLQAACAPLLQSAEAPGGLQKGRGSAKTDLKEASVVAGGAWAP